GPGMRHEDRVRNIEPQYQGMESELRAPRWLRALNFLLRIVFFPVRRPIRFLMIALVAFMLFNTLRGFGVGRLISGYVADVSSARQRADTAMSSVSSFVEKRIMRPSQDAAAPPTPPAPIASPSPAGAPPPRAAGRPHPPARPPPRQSPPPPRLPHPQQRPLLVSTPRAPPLRGRRRAIALAQHNRPLSMT